MTGASPRVAGRDQPVARVGAHQAVAQVEVVDDALHVGARLLAQRDPLLLGLQPRPLPLPNARALDGDGLHAALELVALQERHGEHEDERAHRHGDEEEEHGRALKVDRQRHGVGLVSGDETASAGRRRSPAPKDSASPRDAGVQKSKLIMFFITTAPMPIQTAAPASSMLPIGLGEERDDVVGRYDVDEGHHHDRQGADDGGRGLGLHAHRLDLALHLLAVAQHGREVAERLRHRAAGLGLDADDDGEEVRLRHGHAVVHLLQSRRDGDAGRLALDDAGELAAHRLRRFLGDDVDAVVERQARLDAAHDDVDGVRQLVEEGLHALLAAAVDVETGQEGEADAARDEGDEKARAARRRPRGGQDAAHDAHDQIGRLRPGEPGLLEPAGQRHLADALLLALDVLDGRLHLLATVALGALLDLGRARRRGADRADALLARALGRDAVVERRIGESAHAECGQEGDEEDAGVHESCLSGSASRGALSVVGDFGRVERPAERLGLAEIAGALPEAGLADAGRAVAADDACRPPPRR